MGPTKRNYAIGDAIRHFFMGMAHIFDFRGVLLPEVSTLKSDAEALRSDWEAVGQDFRTVMGDWDKFPKEERRE